MFGEIIPNNGTKYGDAMFLVPLTKDSDVARNDLEEDDSNVSGVTGVTQSNGDNNTA